MLFDIFSKIQFHLKNQNYARMIESHNEERSLTNVVQKTLQIVNEWLNAKMTAYLSSVLLKLKLVALILSLLYYSWKPRFHQGFQRWTHT